MNGKELFEVLETKNVPVEIENLLCEAKEVIDKAMDLFQDEIGSIGDDEIVLDDEEQFMFTTDQKTRKVVKMNAYCMEFEDGGKCNYDDMSYGETLDFLTKVRFMFDDIEYENSEGK